MYLAAFVQPARALAASDRELSAVAGRAGGSDVFMVDSDETIKHFWRTDKNGRWTGFEQLDGLAHDVAAIEMGDGTFEVYVVGLDDKLWVNRQLGRGLWSGFRQLHVDATRVAIAKSSRGRHELFVIGAQGAVFRSVRNQPEQPWSAWQDLGGVATQLAAASARDGSVRVFAVGSDRAVWTTDSRKSAWKSLGGDVSDVTLGRGEDGSSSLFAIGSGGSVWRRHAPDGVRFGGWEQLAGTAQRLAASDSLDLFALDASLSEFQHDTARWRKLAYDNLPLEATFVANATLEIPSLNVTQHKHLRIGVRFSADRRSVKVTSFPAFTTRTFDTPFGKSRTTVSLKSGGSGSFDPQTGRMELPVTLHLDQSLDVPLVEEDADLVLVLSTTGERGAAVPSGASDAKLSLAATSRFVGGGLNPLRRKACNVTISGWFPFTGKMLGR
jgi:hypothetical protein